MNGEPMRYFLDRVLTYEGDECLPWPYADDGKGYGVMNIGGKVAYVHREICEWVHGPAPTRSHKATYSCGKGNEGCCTKRHLFWKTHGTSTRGERHGQVKLTEAAVREIRSLKGVLLQREIAAKFGISRTSVSLIQSKKNWGWLDA